MIHLTLNDTLGGKTYQVEKVSDWCKKISDGIKARIKDMGYDRYKVDIFNINYHELINLVNNISCEIYYTKEDRILFLVNILKIINS